MRIRAVLAVGAMLLGSSARAEDWPAWRGARGDGTSLEKGLPTRWSATENVAWRAEIPGAGHSSPVVHGERIYLTTCLEDREERVVLCLERATGAIRWQRAVAKAPLERRHPLNSHASSTPAADGERVFAAFLDGQRMRVFCLDAEGRPLWDRSPGEFHSVHGFCSSAVLWRDKVILNGDQDAEAWIVALDRATGEERWRIDRPNKMRSYCAPTIFQAGGRTQMVLSGSICVASYDPDTGKPWWTIDGPTDQMVAGVILARDVFFVTGGYPDRYFWGLPTDRSGKLEEKDVLWEGTRHVSYVPSPVTDGERFYVVSDTGTASCLEARTGKVLWTRDLGGRHSASLVHADGHVYFLSDRGECRVVAAGAEYREVALNRLEEETNASMAVSRGQLFLRSSGHLWAIGKGPGEAGGR